MDASQRRPTAQMPALLIPAAKASPATMGRLKYVNGSMVPFRIDNHTHSRDRTGPSTLLC
jgi:hypothetical protein